MRRLPAIVVMMTTILLAPTPPSFAGGIPMQCPNGTTVTVEFTAAEDEFQANLEQACAPHQGSAEGASQGSGNESTSQGSQGHWEWTGYVCANGGICASTQLCEDGSPQLTYVFIDANGVQGDTQTFCPEDPEVPVTVTPPTLAQLEQAFQRVKPPKAVLSVQPPGGKTLVNLETIFSTQAKAFSTGQLDLVPGYTVEFTVTPKAYTWSFDDEVATTTDWPGEPWSKDADIADLITHVYAQTGEVDASVTVTWGATASVNGGSAQRINATVSTTSEVVGLDILEATPQLALR